MRQTTTTRAGRGKSDRLSVHLTTETTALVREAQAAEQDRLRREAPVTTYVDVMVAEAAQAMVDEAAPVVLTRAGAVHAMAAGGHLTTYGAAVNDAASDEELGDLEQAFAALGDLASAGLRAAQDRNLGAAALIATRIVACTAALAQAVETTVSFDLTDMPAVAGEGAVS